MRHVSKHLDQDPVALRSWHGEASEYEMPQLSCMEDDEEYSECSDLQGLVQNERIESGQSWESSVPCQVFHVTFDFKISEARKDRGGPPGWNNYHSFTLFTIDFRSDYKPL